MKKTNANDSAYKFLPPLYRILLRCSNRRGMQTVARFHFSLFRRGGTIYLPGGARMFIPGNKHFIGYLVGLHEEHIDRVISAAVSQGDTCVDVGANIGYFAVKMAHQAGPSGHLYCFEPDAANFEVLQKNVALAERRTRCSIVAKQMAVSSRAATMELLAGAECTGHQVRDIGADARGSNTVTAITLDEELANEEKPIALVKVDVEGHELDVLRGASVLLREQRVRRWVLEVWPGKDVIEIERLLTQCGYKICVWLDAGWAELPLKDLPYRTDLMAIAHLE
jgi:FkbM family methyltransferase